MRLKGASNDILAACRVSVGSFYPKNSVPPDGALDEVSAAAAEKWLSFMNTTRQFIFPGP